LSNWLAKLCRSAMRGSSVEVSRRLVLRSGEEDIAVVVEA
jgi:hypothetical protein